MARFSDALDRSMEEIKRPPPLPIGHYIMQVTKMPDPPAEMKSDKGEFERLTIPVQIISATDDVDPDELSAFGNVAGSPLRLDFIFNNTPGEETKFEGTLNRLKEFLGKCGVDVDSGSLSEKLAELPGCQFIGEVKHRPDGSDPNILYNEIGRTTSA